MHQLKGQEFGLLGGSGFVGARLASALVEAGAQVRIFTRNREGARNLWLLPGCRVLEVDARDPAALTAAAAGLDGFVNLVGILNERGDRGDGFRRAHVDITANAIAACRAAGVGRLLQVSALRAAPDAPSHYLRSKGEAETLLRAAHGPGLAVTILRPSVIFGPGDSFTRRFADLLALAPGVFPLACAGARFQPVYVDDVVAAALAVLAGTTTGDGAVVLDLGGPEILTLEQIVRAVATACGRHTVILPLGPALSRLQANLFEQLPGKPFSRDNLRSTLVDSVCPGDNGLHVLGIAPTALGAVLPALFGRRAQRGRYDALRTSARR